MNNYLGLAGFLISLTLTSCAYQSQVIRLDPALPAVQAAAQSPSADRDVVLTTRDARVFQEIGRRAKGSDKESAITTDTDIAALLRTQMLHILKAKGYRVLTEAPATAPTLEVSLKELTYAIVDEADGRKLKIQVSLEAVVKSGTKTFRNTYRAQQERKVFMEPVAKTNEEAINETFANALKELANDAELYSYL